MPASKIEPHKITKPIQLMAVWFVALLLIDSAFLTGAAKISSPSWAAPALVIAAIAFVPVFIICVFLMQTRFRPELLEDRYYAQWSKQQQERFKGFKPENAVHEHPSLFIKNQAGNPGLEEMRIKRYEANQGLFLVHAWRPSDQIDQIADIVIWLHQHGRGPLAMGDVECVAYQLGPKFFEGPQLKTNVNEQFQIEVSAFGPMLCIANVYLKGQRDPLVLERYIDFEEVPSKVS